MSSVPYQTLLENSPVVTYMAHLRDYGLQVSYVSANAVTLLGVDAATLCGDKRTWAERLDVEGEVLNPRDGGALNQDKKLERCYYLRRQDGRQLWLLETLQWQGASSADAPMLIGTLTDISAARPGDGALLGRIAHELRTPLTGIKMFAGLLANADSMAEAEHGKYLNIISAEVDVLNRMIATARDLQRLWQGDMVWNDEPVDVTEVLAKVVRPFAVSCQIKGIELDCEMDSDVPVILLDGERWALVIHNLLATVLRFTHQGSVKVILRIERDVDAKILLSVTGGGPGMSPEQLGGLIDLSAAAPADEMGLYVVQGIVAHYNGCFRAEPASSGGVVFSVELPAHLIAAPDGWE